VAQNATPTGGTKFGGANYQQLHVVVTDDGYQIPTDIKSGLTVITIENQSSYSDAGLTIVTPKDDQSADDLISEIGKLQEDESGALPSIIYDISFTGGTSAMPGQTTESLVKLEEGDLVFFPQGGDQDPVKVHVSGAEGDQPDEPDADLTIEMKEFEFDGLSDQISAGDHLVKVSNTGDQPHLLTIVGLPSGTTDEQFTNYVTSALTGTPATGPTIDESQAQISEVGNIAFLSAGNSMWVPLHLDAGTYGAICFVPDKDSDSGQTHAEKGQLKVFTVA
jgi:hypothetical protein